MHYNPSALTRHNHLALYVKDCALHACRWGVQAAYP